MKIIKVDNFNREGPGYDDVLIAYVWTSFWGEHIVELLNANCQADSFFKLVPDDYKLQVFKP